MNTPAGPLKSTKRRFFAQRVVAAMVMLCFATWELYRVGHATFLECLVISVMIVATISRPWSRFFWFLMGTELGIFLALIISHLAGGPPVK